MPLTSSNLAIAVCALIAAPLAAQSAASVQLPNGVKAVWDSAQAWHETTPTRERISINGLWRWQPALSAAQPLPETAWGYLRVPEPWPSGNQRSPSRFFYPHPDWTRTSLRSLTAAWYQREFTIPPEWSGRRITLYAEHLNSYAAVFLDGKPAGELRYPAGEIDLTSAVHPGQTHILTMRVDALPLKALMLSFRDTATARTIEGTVARKGLCGDVYLVSTPAGRASPTSRSTPPSATGRSISIPPFTRSTPTASYVLQLRITDGNATSQGIHHQAIQATDLPAAACTPSRSWHPEKLWDTITPQNQYQVSVSLARASTPSSSTPP